MGTDGGQLAAEKILVSIRKRLWWLTISSDNEINVQWYQNQAPETTEGKQKKAGVMLCSIRKKDSARLQWIYCDP